MVTKKAKVIMLPTENSTHIYTGNDGTIYYTKVSKLRFRNEGCHLYITSDEEIKEGDCVTDGKQIGKVFYSSSTGYSVMWGKNFNVGTGDYDYHSLKSIWKKIIATTDTSLTIQHMTGQGNLYNEPLPQIPQPFIEEYCEKDGIDEVLVEYEERQQFESEEDYNYNSHIKIKVNRDNTINILPIKDSWNREEVTRLCRLAFGQGVREGIENTQLMAFQDLENKWIKENLK